MTTCPCGRDEPCPHVEIGYPWCRPCGEHHRGAECPINVQGEALAPCGCTWEQTTVDAHHDGGCPADDGEWEPVEVEIDPDARAVVSVELTPEQMRVVSPAAAAAGVPLARFIADAAIAAAVPADGDLDGDELVRIANEAYGRKELENLRALRDDLIDLGEHVSPHDPMWAAVDAVHSLIEAQVRAALARGL